MFLTSHLLRYPIPGEGEIWFNTMTGAIDWLTRQEADSVGRSSCCRLPDCEDPLLDRMVTRGYLYADRGAEEAAFEGMVERYRDAAASSGNISLILCPTYACNLRCVYCFERQNSPLPQISMDMKAAKAAMDAFAGIRAREPGTGYSLGLFGGEPLLPSTHEVVSQTLVVAQAGSLPVLIVTNGINVPIFMPLLKRFQRTIRSVQLTIDGPTEVHDLRRPTPAGGGTFAAVADAADRLLDAGINVALRVNIDRDNVERLPGLARLALKRGWAGHPACAINLAPVKDHTGLGTVPGHGSEAALLSKLLDVYDRHPGTEKIFGFDGFQLIGPIAAMARTGTLNMPRVVHCEANYGGFWVAGPDGYLYGCPEAIGQPEMAIGRFQDGLEVWDDRREMWTGRDIGSLAECRTCTLGPVCGGGCAYSSLVRHEEAQPACKTDLTEAIGTFLTRRVLPTRAD